MNKRLQGIEIIWERLLSGLLEAMLICVGITAVVTVLVLSVSVSALNGRAEYLREHSTATRSRHP